MDDEARELKKGYLKTLPVWQEVDELRAKADQLSERLDKLLADHKQAFDELDSLPRFNMTQNIKVIQVDEGNVDEETEIVRIYQKNEKGEYVIKNDELSDITKVGRQASIDSLSSKLVEGQEVFAMKRPRKPWVKCYVDAVYLKRNQPGSTGYSSVFHLKLASDPKKMIHVNKYSVAFVQDHKNCLEPPKRVIAGHSEDSLFPGTIAYEPSEHNKSRYLVILDDGSADYFETNQIYPIVGQSEYPWMDARKYIATGTAHNEYYLRYYLLNFPKRDLLCVRQSDYGIKYSLYRDGKLVDSKVIGDDCDIFRVEYEDGTQENIYKGSLRVRKDQHSRLIPGNKPDLRLDIIYDKNGQYKFFYQIPVNMKTYYDTGCAATNEDIYRVSEDFGDILVSKSLRSKDKSLESPERIRIKVDDHDQIYMPELGSDTDSETSDLSNNHKCTHDCLRVEGGRDETQVKDIINEFRNISDLKVPLFLGWKHEIKEVSSKNETKKKAAVFYEAPCGKRFKQIYYLKQYLFKTNSILDIDYFTVETDVDLYSVRHDIDAYWINENIARDYETDKPLENKNIAAINQCSVESLPFDFKYAAKSILHPNLVKLGISLNEEFKSGCDCEDDCQKFNSCSCHRLSDQVFGAINKNQEARYKYKRIENVIQTGLYECNSLCKCSSKCPNRVVGNGIRYRFQVKRTPDKGWGLVTLDDIPKGAFVCTYSAEILDDADHYGSDDMYFADMDYITLNERRKLGPESGSEDEHEESGVESDSNTSDDSKSSIENRSPTRTNQKSKSKSKSSSNNDQNMIDLTNDDIDEETNLVQESSNANRKRQTNSRIAEVRVKKRLSHMVDKETDIDNSFGSSSERKNLRLRNKKTERPLIRRLHQILGTKDYTLDARRTGNIGRFCNHSCEPNCFIQNVFLETHDPRYPVPSLFSNRTIKALEEITWDYQYIIGSIPGRQIDCNCKSKSCKGRIL